MRGIAGRVNTGIVLVCLFFGVVVAGIGAAGVVAVRSATAVGATIAGDELTTAAVTSRLGRQLDRAYSTAQAMMLSPDPARRATLAASLYDPVIPAVDGALADLSRIHSDDPADELVDINVLGEQWRTARALLNPAAQAAAPADISAAFDGLDAHIDQLIARETVDAEDKQTDLLAIGTRMGWGIAAAVALTILATGGLGWFASRRIRRSTEPAKDQMEFADTLQLAETEDEAHHLLQRHLERSVPAAAVTVLNCNNSADRLEPATPVPTGSALLDSLQHAEPRSCLAVRSGRSHEADEQHPALLGCPVCGPCPGRSICIPLTVGGAVIGSVLLSRARRCGPAEQQRLRDSVGQAAPVLANLRNLAIAELRAATDSLTGLPNKRAVTDTLKRILAQASRTLTPACLLMLDLDHFKDINDRFGHPVGDQVLANVGTALRSVLRDSDFAGRNGGEEFAVMLPDTDITGAAITAEKIRAAIAEIVLPGHAITVTASVGIAAYPDHATTAEQLERLADSALYLAKLSGRDRVEIANSSDPPSTRDASTPPDPRRTPTALKPTPSLAANGAHTTLG
jgi:diguanylate cyclase (GGDEF)-like protein